MSRKTRQVIGVNFAADSLSAELKALIDTLSLSTADVERAFLRAINKSARSLRGLLARDVARAALVKIKLVNQRLRVSFASSKTPYALITLFTYSLPAMLLEAEQGAKGVTTRYGNHYFSSGFIQKNVRRKNAKKARPMAFVRSLRARYPLRELRVDMQAAAARVTKKVDIDRHLIALMHKNLLHEIKFIGGVFKKL